MPHGFDYTSSVGLRRHLPLEGEGIFWWRIEAVPIRLLRQPGIEVSDKTEKLPLPNSAVRILRRSPLAPLRKGSCQRS